MPLLPIYMVNFSALRIVIAATSCHLSFSSQDTVGKIEESTKMKRRCMAWGLDVATVRQKRAKQYKRTPRELRGQKFLRTATAPPPTLSSLSPRCELLLRLTVSHWFDDILDRAGGQATQHEMTSTVAGRDEAEHERASRKAEIFLGAGLSRIAR